MVRWLVLGLSLLVLAALSCGFTAPEPTRVPATPEPTHPPGATIVDADIKSFRHTDLEVKTNTVVIWTNRDQPLHTITHISGDRNVPSLWNSGPTAPDTSFRFHFTEPGVYPYQCLIHPVNMRATVTVTE